MRRLLLKLLRRKRLAQDLDAELAFHREMSREHQNAVELGNTSLIKEQAFDLWRFNLLENLFRDLLHAVRSLRASPALLLSAMLSLGLGIGANTAIFQLLDAVRLKTLPVQNPQELAAVEIEGGHGGMGINPGEYPELTRPIWQELRRHQRAFSGIFAWTADGVNIGEGEALHRGNGIWITGEFFRTLGVSPWRGRLISSEDEGPCPSSVVVVSYAYWRTAMGSSEIGNSTILVDGERKEIIGVTPPGFFGLSVGDAFDVAVPLCQESNLSRDVFDVAVMGRLRPGWSVKRAAEELKSISPAIFEATAPEGRSARSIEAYKRFKLTAIPAARGVSVVRDQYSSSLWLLLAITGLVLLIACANLANLLLARASTRDREMAVRLALGASSIRLLQQLLVEAGCLCALGAGIGISLAPLFSRVLIWTLSTEGGAMDLAIGFDWRILLFAAGVATATGLFFGAMPIRRTLQRQPGATLKTAGRGTTASRQRFLTQQALVVTQIAVSLVLLVGALLFVRSFRNLLTCDPGMRESNITVAFVAFQKSRVSPDHYTQFQERLIEEVKSIPGVIDVASTSNVPLVGGSWEHGVRTGSSEGLSKFTWVSPEYFNTMGIPVIAGRDFKSSDSRTSLHVAIVNKTFVRRYLPNANPIGQTLRTIMEPNYPSTLYQIIGVIPDAKYSDLRGDTPPMTFAPASQHPDPGPFTPLMIHSTMPASAVMSALKRVLAQNHPEIVATGGSFEQWIRDGMIRERAMAILSGFFGILAALLAVVGLYGVMSYVITNRRNELGVRMALGATRRQVIGMVLREVCLLVVVGTLIGGALSLLAGQAARTLLFELSPYDPFALAAASVLLIAISLLASFVPARHASKIDPMISLRYE